MGLYLKVGRQEPSHPLQQQIDLLFSRPNSSHYVPTKAIWRVREKCKAAKSGQGFLQPARFRMMVDGSSRTFSDPADREPYLSSHRESLRQDYIASVCLRTVTTIYILLQSPWLIWSTIKNVRKKKCWTVSGKVWILFYFCSPAITSFLGLKIKVN